MLNHFSAQWNVAVLFCKCQWKMSTLNHSTMFVCVLCCFTHEVFLSVYFSLRGNALLILLCTIFWQVLNLCEQKWFLFMMCQITVLRVDLLGCIQPLIWLNLNGIKCLLVGPWLAYSISHFNEKHSHANTVCLEWGQMQLSWLMKAFDHISTNRNLEKGEAIWTGIYKPMNYLVHIIIIHKSLWRGGLMRF